MNPRWERAVCATDPDRDDWFAPAGTARQARAIKVCGGCPVQENCATFAAESGVRFGVWAGVDQAEAIEIERKRKHAAKARARARNLRTVGPAA